MNTPQPNRRHLLHMAVAGSAASFWPLAQAQEVKHFHRA